MILSQLLWYRTSSHVIEPAYPGVKDHLVPLGSCWDTKQLRAKKDEILQLCDLKAACYKRCYRFLEAASSFIYDSYRICAECVDLKKISNYAVRFVTKNLKPIDDKRGHEYKRLLVGITGDGVVFLQDTVVNLCENIIVLNDNYGVVSHNLLSAIRSKACERGYDVYSCLNPLNPEKIDHILIPEAGLAIITNNKLNPVTITPTRTIHSSRFTNLEKLKKHKKRLSQNNRFSIGLVNDGIEILTHAKQYHRKLEEIYTPSVDFKKVDSLFDDVIDSLG